MIKARMALRKCIGGQKYHEKGRTPSDKPKTVRWISRTKEMAEFKPGDVVRVAPIKGPWMIVESCGESTAECFWFDKDDAGHRETFATAFLEQKKTETSGISGFAGSRRSQDS
jgi:uncharacterized protein YodC (DUF2158 family)